MPPTHVNPLTWMKSSKPQPSLSRAWPPVWSTKQFSFATCFLQNAKKNPVCYQNPLGKQLRALVETYVYALYMILAKWQGIITHLSNLHFQVRADSDETTCRTVQLSWTMLFSKPPPKLIQMTKYKPKWSDNSSSAHKLVNDEGNGLPMEDGHIQWMMYSILQQQAGTSLLCYATGL